LVTNSLRHTCKAYNSPTDRSRRKALVTCLEFVRFRTDCFPHRPLPPKGIGDNCDMPPLDLADLTPTDRSRRKALVT